MTNARRLAALRDAQDRPSDGAPSAATLAAAAEHIEPITDELLKRLGKALLWRIVVEPYIPKQRGLLAMAPQVEDAERILSCVGRIVLVGSQAWKSKTSAGINLEDEPYRPSVGQYALHEMYAGKEVHLTTGHTLRVLTDSECLMVIDDPDLIRGYL